MGQLLDMNTTLRHLLFLLEYCMVTGYDWWDVLLHVQPAMVHSLVEKLHEEYMRQNHALQQVRTHPEPRKEPCSTATVVEEARRTSAQVKVVMPHCRNTSVTSPVTEVLH